MGTSKSVRYHFKLTKKNTKKENTKRTNNKANNTMKLFSLITACLITNLVAIPINIDSDDLATVDQIQSSHELTPEILAEPNDLVGNNEEPKLLSRDRRRVKNRNRNGRKGKKSKRKDKKRREKKRLRARELAKNRREVSSYRKLRGFNRFRPRH